jgi:hypothetical protein
MRRELLTDDIATSPTRQDRRRETGAGRLRLSRAHAVAAAAVLPRDTQRQTEPGEPAPRRGDPVSSSPADAAGGWNRR